MPQNGQTHFKNLAASAARFLNCVWPFYDIAKWRVNFCLDNNDWRVLFYSFVYLPYHWFSIWSSFLFLQTFLLINSISVFWSLNLLSSTSYLANLFPKFWLFLLFFWMLWMLVTVNKPYHVPHSSRITTWGTIFMDVFFGVLEGMIQLILKRSLKYFWQAVQKQR